MAPFNSGAPDGFDPDRTEYVVLVPVGKNAVGIVASAEHSGATVTGIGDVQITDRSETITKDGYCHIRGHVGIQDLHDHYNFCNINLP